jgi:hypothetical protein
MTTPYSGLPAAASVEQSILLAQLELLRRLDPGRVEAARAALLSRFTEPAPVGAPRARP